MEYPVIFLTEKEKVYLKEYLMEELEGGEYAQRLPYLPLLFTWDLLKSFEEPYDYNFFIRTNDHGDRIGIVEEKINLNLDDN